jgi:hypothetical protein
MNFRLCLRLPQEHSSLSISTLIDRYNNSEPEKASETELEIRAELAQYHKKWSYYIAGDRTERRYHERGQFKGTHPWPPPFRRSRLASM